MQNNTNYTQLSEENFVFFPPLKVSGSGKSFGNCISQEGNTSTCSYPALQAASGKRKTYFKPKVIEQYYTERLIHAGVGYPAVPSSVTTRTSP